jgi:hypothetical protein
MKKQVVRTIRAENTRELAELRANAFKTKTHMNAVAYSTKIRIEAD